MRKANSPLSIAMRLFVFSSLLLSMNACYIGPSFHCILLVCWDGDSESGSSHETPLSYTPSYPVTDYSDDNNWKVDLTNNTAAVASNGLQINGTTADFIKNKNSSGGHLLLRIDAASASQSCDVKVHAQIDGIDLISKPVLPIALSTFMPESLGTDCLSKVPEEGSSKGIAIFELAEAPKSLKITEFEFVSPVDHPQNSVGSRGSIVTTSLSPYSYLLNVTITAAEGDNNPVTPLFFEGFVTGSPYDFKNNELYEKLEIDPLIKNLRRDEEKNSISYDYSVKNFSSSYLYYGVQFHVTAVRDADL